MGIDLIKLLLCQSEAATSINKVDFGRWKLVINPSVILKLKSRVNENICIAFKRL